MNYPIVYAPLALEDMTEIRDYIETELCNPQAAIHVIETILHTVHKLQTAPEMGALLSSVMPIESSYRFLVAGHYMVFYRFENSTIYIDRVLYGKRNYMRILFN